MGKRLFALLLTALLLLASGCGAEEEGTQLSLGGDAPAEGTAAPESGAPDSSSTADSAVPSPASEALPSPQSANGPAALAVTATAAHAFSGTLYGAAAYENTGGAPLVLTEARFTFTVDGRTVAETFPPVMAEYDVVAPGDTAYCVLFLPAEGVEAGAEVSLAAELRFEAAEGAAFPLLAEDAMLIENYPNFATLSGSIGNPKTAAAPCELNMITAGFYDESDAFLGAWYFSKNASLSPGVEKAFVSHLRAMPIPDLAANTARIDLRAFGIE